jgi:hypothetical protein
MILDISVLDGLKNFVGAPLGHNAELYELISVEKSQDFRLADLHLLRRFVDHFLRCSYHDETPSEF